MTIDQAPPAPPPPPAAPAVVGGINPLSSQPLGPQEVSALRNARSELSRQLTSASERRNELMEQLKNAPAEGRAGLEQRIQLLDQRLLTLEGDIQTVGRQLALAPRAGTEGQPSPFPPGRGQREFDPELVIPILAIIFVGVAALRLVWNRGRRTPVAPQRDPQVDARMERLEQAVDAVAIEVERIGESQRYQAKLLAEGTAPLMAFADARAREAVRRD